jgi:hypothetical protein
VLRSVVRGAGGRPSRVRTTTIGFAAVKSLLAGRVDAATGFWNVEGVALKARRPGFREFRVDDYGAPRYPELVLCVSRETLQDEPDTVRAAIRALQRGYGVVRRDPESAASAMLERERSLDRENLMRQLDAVAPAYQAGVPAYGQLVAERLREWAEWDVEFGILRRAPTSTRRSTPRSWAGSTPVGRRALLGAQAPEVPSHGLRAAPHLGDLHRPVRSSRRMISPRMPVVSSSFSVPCTAGTDAACPNWWATGMRQCQSCLEYGCALQLTTRVAAST